MVHQPDLWHTLGTGAFGKEVLRVTTGGTTGTTLVCAADNLVASGLHDVVMAIGFEKLQEGHTTGGITNMADPLWGRQLQTGALTGLTAAKLIHEFGEERAKRASMKYRIIMDKHAGLNPNAHRSFGLDFGQIPDLMENSPKLVGELRLIHMCSQSDGACVLILADEKKAIIARMTGYTSIEEAVKDVDFVIEAVIENLALERLSKLYKADHGNVQPHAGAQANMAAYFATLKYGDTVLLATVVANKKEREGLDFFPLTMDYQEKAFAAGKIPGGYFKREGKPTENSRLLKTKGATYTLALQDIVHKAYSGIFRGLKPNEITRETCLIPFLKILLKPV
jgi:hypothetical protein